MSILFPVFKYSTSISEKDSFLNETFDLIFCNIEIFVKININPKVLSKNELIPIF